jgi:hypothetical protein
MDLNDLDSRVVFALVIMVIGAIRWFLEQVREKKGGQDATEQASEDFEDLYEEARREIQTRQAQAPQQPSTPPPIAPPFPVKAVVRPASTTAAAPPPPLPDWQRTVVKPTLSKAEQAALSRVQQQSSGPHQGQGRRTDQNGSRIRRLLSSPGAARDAIVLGEILGPPKGAV